MAGAEVYVIEHILLHGDVFINSTTAVAQLVVITVGYIHVTVAVLIDVSPQSGVLGVTSAKANNSTQRWTFLGCFMRSSHFASD